MKNKLNQVQGKFNKTKVTAFAGLVFYIAVSFLFSGLYACKEKSTITADSIEVEKPFFPVSAYFISEIDKIDSGSLIQLLLIANNKTIDSGNLTVAQFIKLAAPFSEINIEDSSGKKQYQQDIFLDLSTNRYSFTYTAINDTLPIQYLHILVDTITQTASRVFINERFQKKDTIINRKMGWKTEESFYINTIFQLPGKEDSITRLSVKWMK